jgi:mycothiol synthase
MILNDRHHLGWPVARLDYWRWHVVLNCRACPAVEEATTLWETSAGEIAAVLNPEGMGEAHPQVHPGRVTPELVAEMVAVAEERLAQTREDGQRTLSVWIHEYDRLQQEVAARMGYIRGKWPEYHRRRSLDGPVPELRPTEGYTVRPLGGPDELPARSWASWRAFHPDEADEAYTGWEWYHNIQRQPLYRRDLDIVAVAPDGAIAAFTTLWYDDVTRDAYFEPVGVMPEHQRRGLGKAVMLDIGVEIRRQEPWPRVQAVESCRIGGREYSDGRRARVGGAVDAWGIGKEQADESVSRTF